MGRTIKSLGTSAVDSFSEIVDVSKSKFVRIVRSKARVVMGL